MATGIKFQFKMAKETERLIKRMADSPKALGDALTSASKTISVEYVFRLKKAILSQQDARDNPPLSDEWAAYKAKRNLDPRKWLATMAYFNSIEAGPVTSASGLWASKTWGVRAMAERAVQLEYGNGRAPARPHWAPVLRRMNGFINVVIREEIVHVLAGK